MRRVALTVWVAVVSLAVLMVVAVVAAVYLAAAGLGHLVLEELESTPSVFAADVVEAAGAGFEWRRIDRVAVKGRTASVAIYEMFGPIMTRVALTRSGESRAHRPEELVI